MNVRASLRTSGFSLQEMLVVIAIIGVTTLIVLPAVTGLTASAEQASAKRNAQMLASVAAAAQASGDPVMRNLKSKPAIVSYLGSGLSTDGPGGSVARVGYSGLSPEETLSASRYLTYNPASGGISFTGGSRVNPITDQPEDSDNQPDPEEQRNKWNARLLEGASEAAISSGDTSLALAGSKSSAISFLVDGGIGGNIVANMSAQDQSGAASFLEYVSGRLRFEDN